ncbi:MAG: hypothetical protein EZS28_028798, partial [Streblomastix strix]
IGLHSVLHNCGCNLEIKGWAIYIQRDQNGENFTRVITALNELGGAEQAASQLLAKLLEPKVINNAMKQSFVDFEFLPCPVHVFNNVSSRPITTSYVAAECLNEYTYFPFIPIKSSNFFNLSEIWPLLAGIVMSSFHHYALYLLSLKNQLCLLSILFKQSKKIALGHTVLSLVFGSLCE